MRRIAIVFVLAIAFILLVNPSAKAADGENFIKLTEPKDNFMTSSNRIVVSGETVPKSSVTVLVNGHSKAELSVGAAGIFLTQVSISPKENVVTVRALYPSGDKETVSRRVYQLDSQKETPALDSLIQTLKTFLILK